MLFPKYPTSQPNEHQGHQTTVRCEGSDLAGRNQTAATKHPKEGSGPGQHCPTSLQWVGWFLLHLCYFSSSSDYKKLTGRCRAERVLHIQCRWEPRCEVKAQVHLNMLTDRHHSQSPEVQEHKLKPSVIMSKGRAQFCFPEYFCEDWGCCRMV